jgi:hypothetical protein
MISTKELFTNILSIWIHGTFIWFEFLGLLLIYALCNDFKERSFYKHSFDLNSWNIRSIWILGSLVNIRVVWWYQRKNFLQHSFNLNSWNIYLIWILGSLLIYALLMILKKEVFTNILSIWIHGTFVRFEFLGLKLIYALCDDINERTFYKHSFNLNSWKIHSIFNS